MKKYLIDLVNQGKILSVKVSFFSYKQIMKCVRNVKNVSSGYSFAEFDSEMYMCIIVVSLKLRVDWI